jgi:exo-1,4-beta-D-glucosaminidase
MSTSSESLLTGTFASTYSRLLSVFMLSASSLLAQVPGNRMTVAIPPIVQLQHDWLLQSSARVAAKGETISSASFQPKGWYQTKIPSTVLASQVAAGDFPDPYVGMNLRNIPGTTYPIGLNSFNLVPMGKDSPYTNPWWYRTSFRLPDGYEGKHVALHLDGLNYRADIWLNGKKVADGSDVAGAYRLFEFDVTFLLQPGANVLAVEVSSPTENDLTINWVDWNPAPPDRDMGLWGQVYLSASGPVTLRHPQLTTHLPDDTLRHAELTITAQAHNTSTERVTGAMEATVDGIHVRQDVTLEPGESRSITFLPDKFSELRLTAPKLWWPRQMGEPALHELTTRFIVEGKLSDDQRAQVGFREITSELTDKGSRLFRINGKPILIRGAAWTQDMMLRPIASDKLDAEFAYVRDMHLNTIRLEAQLGPDIFFDMADREGILVMAGWACCDVWEQWAKWQPTTIKVATESLRSELLRLRSHPSMLVWLNGSDGPPPANVESAYLQVEKEVSWPNPVLSSASDQATTVSGNSGVKMSGPYDYEPPSYWLTDQTKYGGAWGYNTETSPGPAIPPLDSLKKMLPAEHLWPIDQFWDYHAAGERFKTLDRFNEAMNATYGPPSGLGDYLLKAQAMAYDGERAMFEAYGRNKYVSTGLIQWMLNNAWPSTYWHLYDYYLYPAGGYFGTKKACEPLHIQYSYDDRSVVVVNDLQKSFHDLVASARVYDIDLKPIFSRDVKLDSAPDSAVRALTLDPLPLTPAHAVYFVKLSLTSAEDRREISSNFYWLPAQPSVLAWDKTPDTAFTPIASFEDLTALNNLPYAHLQVTAGTEGNITKQKVRVTLRNDSKYLAFQIHLGVRRRGSSDEILPVLWEDNYLTLMPQESKVVVASYLSRDALGKEQTVVVDGWNISPIRLNISTATVPVANQ